VAHWRRLIGQIYGPTQKKATTGRQDKNPPKTANSKWQTANGKQQMAISEHTPKTKMKSCTIFCPLPLTTFIGEAVDVFELTRDVLHHIIIFPGSIFGVRATAAAASATTTTTGSSTGQPTHLRETYAQFTKSTHVLLFLKKRGDDGVVGNRRHLQLCLDISINTGQETGHAREYKDGHIKRMGKAKARSQVQAPSNATSITTSNTMFIITFNHAWKSPIPP